MDTNTWCFCLERQSESSRLIEDTLWGNNSCREIRSICELLDRWWCPMESISLAAIRYQRYVSKVPYNLKVISCTCCFIPFNWLLFFSQLHQKKSHARFRIQSTQKFTFCLRLPPHSEVHSECIRVKRSTYTSWTCSCRHYKGNLEGWIWQWRQKLCHT